MGAGKTTVGLGLARRLGLPFVDLDQFIESREGLTVADLFEAGGESRFRTAERSALQTMVDGPPAVLACGGGTPCQPGNLALLEAWSTVVFLDVPFDVIQSRIEGGKDRPLWAEDALSRYQRRLPLYRRASVRVDGAQEVPAVVEQVVTALEQAHG